MYLGSKKIGYAEMGTLAAATLLPSEFKPSLTLSDPKSALFYNRRVPKKRNQALVPVRDSDLLRCFHFFFIDFTNWVFVYSDFEKEFGVHLRVLIV